MAIIAENDIRRTMRLLAIWREVGLDRWFVSDESISVCILGVSVLE